MDPTNLNQNLLILNVFIYPTIAFAANFYVRTNANNHIYRSSNDSDGEPVAALSRVLVLSALPLGIA